MQFASTSLDANRVYNHTNLSDKKSVNGKSEALASENEVLLSCYKVMEQELKKIAALGVKDLTLHATLDEAEVKRAYMAAALVSMHTIYTSISVSASAEVCDTFLDKVWNSVLKRNEVLNWNTNNCVQSSLLDPEKRVSWTECFDLLNKKTGVAQLDRMSVENKACFYIDAVRAENFAKLMGCDQIKTCPFLALLFDMDDDPGYLRRTVESWTFMNDYTGEIDINFYKKLNEVSAGKSKDGNVRTQPITFAIKYANISPLGLVNLMSHIRSINDVACSPYKLPEESIRLFEIDSKQAESESNARVVFTAETNELKPMRLDKGGSTVYFRPRVAIGLDVNEIFNGLGEISEVPVELLSELADAIHEKFKPLSNPFCHVFLGDQKAEEGEKLIAAFIDKAKKSETAEEVIEHSTGLEHVHFYDDANTRSAILFASKVLLARGKAPLLLDDPNCIDGLSAREALERSANYLNRVSPDSTLVSTSETPINARFGQFG